jgi:hypothetical protein
MRRAKQMGKPSIVWRSQFIKRLCRKRQDSQIATVTNNWWFTTVPEVSQITNANMVEHLDRLWKALPDQTNVDRIAYF